MIRMVLIATAVAFGVTAVAAQSDPIAARKALMKETGAQAGIGGKIMRGEEPFELAKAQRIFTTFEETAAKAHGLFPTTARTGGDTAALPAIWEKNDDFKARFDKMGADAKAAKASVKDLDSFKAAYPAVTRNCGGCHETYRAKRG
jgi:cytochrome c556